VAPLQLRIELEFLGTFVKFQEAAVSFFMSVRPSARMEQLGYHCTDFDGIWYLSVFRKYIDKIQI